VTALPADRVFVTLPEAGDWRANARPDQARSLESTLTWPPASLSGSLGTSWSSDKR
jgi:hypothetical protein